MRQFIDPKGEPGEREYIDVDETTLAGVASDLVRIEARDWEGDHVMLWLTPQEAIALADNIRDRASVALNRMGK